MSDVLKRKYRLELTAEADSPSALAAALYNLATRVDLNDLSSDGVWGGYDNGGFYKLIIDEEMTHEKYVEGLKRRKAKVVCPYCDQPAPEDWTPAQVAQGYKYDGGTKVYHCHMAAD